MAATEVAGEVRWQRENDGELRLGAREITADNADLATRSRFAMRLPADGGGPVLDLRTEFRDLAFAKVPDYLPSQILKEKLTGWFEHAFVGGSIPQGTLLFQGAVADFPFDDKPGRFQALLAVRDGTLNFHRDWPPLTGLAGAVRFENRGMRISLAEGRLLDSELIAVSARIPDLGRAVAVEVQGRVEGPFADELRILGETPLRRRLGVLAQVFRQAGKARLELDMAIPLRTGDTDSLRLAGELSWPGPAALAIPDQGIALTGLVGSLRFTARDLEARSIEAKLWGVPVRLAVATRRSGKDTAVTTQIRVTGRFPTPVLARQFPAQAWELLQGRAHLALDLMLTGADLGGSVPPLDFELTSDLAGLGYPGCLWRSRYRSGTGPGQRRQAAAGPRGLQSGRPCPSWAVQLDARELAGKLTLPRRSRGGPVRVRLARLDLKGLFEQKHEDGKASTDRPHSDPRQARALDLDIERLLWGEHALGRVTLRSQLEPGGLEFTRISLTGPVIAIRGRGSWRRQDAGPRSNLSLTARSRDLGEFLRSLEFKSLLHKTPAELDLDLGWPGAPGRFEAADLQGHIRLDLGAGSLVEVEPGVGRVLGILNLEALRRRLDLDFNDLFGPGYAFEKISGRFDIEQGVATTRELLIEGSSADVSIAGSTDLVEQEFDQIVTVTPHLGAGAAIAGAVGTPGRGGRLPGRSGIRWGDRQAGSPPISPRRTLGRARDPARRTLARGAGGGAGGRGTEGYPPAVSRRQRRGSVSGRGLTDFDSASGTAPIPTCKSPTWTRLGGSESKK